VLCAAVTESIVNLLSPVICSCSAAAACLICSIGQTATAEQVAAIWMARGVTSCAMLAADGHVHWGCSVCAACILCVCVLRVFCVCVFPGLLFGLGACRDAEQCTGANLTACTLLVVSVTESQSHNADALNSRSPQKVWGGN
jgi:hypothetical protein